MSCVKSIKFTIRERGDLPFRNTYNDLKKRDYTTKIACNYSSSKDEGIEFVVIDLFLLKNYNKIKIDISNINHGCERVEIQIINSFLVSYNADIILIDKSIMRFKKIEIFSHHDIQLRNILATKYVKCNNVDYGMDKVEHELEKCIDQIREINQINDSAFFIERFDYFLNRLSFYIDYGTPWNEDILRDMFKFYVNYSKCVIK